MSEKARFPQSSAIRAIRFDRRGLEVTFASGSVYLYRGVSRNVFERFRLADSAGKFFNEEILDRYPFARLR